MQRTVLILAGIIAAVGLLGFVALPWFKDTLGLNSKDVAINVLSAIHDKNVGVSATSNVTVEKIVAEIELIFPYGTAPDNISDLTVHDYDESIVDVNWGRGDPEKVDVEGRAQTKLIIREAFFPTDFKQGKLYLKDKFLGAIKMPPVKEATEH